MTGLFIIALASASAISIAAASDPKVPVVPLFGQWKPVSVIRDGAIIKPDEHCYFSFSEKTFDVVIGSTPTSFRYTIDTSKTPSWFDCEQIDDTPSDTQRPIRTIKGIYKLSEGRLTRCMGKPGGERPAQFGSTRGDGNELSVLERVSTVFTLD